MQTTNKWVQPGKVMLSVFHAIKSVATGKVHVSGNDTQAQAYIKAEMDNFSPIEP